MVDRRFSPTKVGEWYKKAFEEASQGLVEPTLYGVSLKVLEEVVELCLAAGATSIDISDHVVRTLIKEARKNEGLKSEAQLDEEIADVYITLDALCAVAEITEGEVNEMIDQKMEINQNRKWAVNSTGSLSHVKQTPTPGST